MNWPKFIFKMAGIVHRNGIRYDEGFVGCVFAPDIYSAEQLMFRKFEAHALCEGWEWVNIFRSIGQQVNCEDDVSVFLSKWEHK